MIAKRLFALLCALWCFGARGQEVIPPAPENHFNDYASVVSPSVAQNLNNKLENFERSTGSQIVVAIYPHMQSDSSIEDYTIRVARAWKVGQKEKNNGAVLFVFTKDRKMFLQVGYGLEGALPDALCKEIIEYEIKPHFKNGDYAGGLTAGIDAILAAAQHEYKGTGHTVADTKWDIANHVRMFLPFLIILLFIVLQIWMRGFSRRTGGRWGGWTISSGGSSGWSSGGGGGGFSGGGSFSGGGGSFGGGGAGGSW